MMKWSARYWLVAAAVSAFVHAAALLPFAVSGESVQIERSAGAPVVVASLSAAQALNAGEDALLTALEAEPELVEPVDTLQEAEEPAGMSRKRLRSNRSKHRLLWSKVPSLRRRIRS